MQKESPHKLTLIKMIRFLSTERCDNTMSHEIMIDSPVIIQHDFLLAAVQLETANIELI